MAEQFAAFNVPLLQRFTAFDHLTKQHNISRAIVRGQFHRKISMLKLLLYFELHDMKNSAVKCVGRIKQNRSVYLEARKQHSRGIKAGSRETQIQATQNRPGLPLCLRLFCFNSHSAVVA